MRNFGPATPFVHPACSPEQSRMARHPLSDLDGMALTLHYQRGEIICSETRGEEYLYRLTCGAALRLHTRPGARRLALDVMVPGDYFGFSVADKEGVAMEAAEDDTEVCVYPHWCVSFLTDVDPLVAPALKQLELEAIARTRVHLFCRRRLSAVAKVGSFLIEMGNRLTLSATGWFELPTTLEAIADYLELSASTMELCLSLLARRAAIARAGGRCVRIDDRFALENEGSWPAFDGIQPSVTRSAVKPYRAYRSGDDFLAAPRAGAFSRVR